MGCRIFSGFSRRISSPHFCGKGPEKSSRKIPAKSSKICITKFPTYFCTGAGPRYWSLCHASAQKSPPGKSRAKVRQEKRTQILAFLVPETSGRLGSSARRGCGREVRALPRKFVFLGLRREELGMSWKFCWDVPDAKKICLLISEAARRQQK